MYQHADHPWALADFDRRFTRKEDNAPGILECKSCTYHKAGDWADDAYPIYYELQLRFYLAVADVEIAMDLEAAHAIGLLSCSFFAAAVATD